MNAALLRVSDFLRQGDYRSAAGPVLIILILAMMVLPLPPFILDLLFTFNIALSIIVLLISMHTLKPLDFSSFPSILLITTLMRLSLNVASTRVVLMEGHTGPDAAGKVIEAFGHFLVGGNYTVGIVLFVILIIINFMVISKGAGRIAEVSARFTLDAMPGKQMAIDADLNAGLIREDEARRRRQNIAQEAEFFGSMDGASKFVRGDSVAGIAILLINIVGGLAVGVLQHGMDIGHAATNYTLLTIGDGLVAQIPALVISTAAGIMVSRVSTDKDIGQQLSTELFGMPAVLLTTAGVIGLLGLVPGMPHFPFILFSGLLGYTGWYLKRKREVPAVQPVLQAIAPVDTPEASWDDVAWVDVLGLEIGYRLIPLVDKSQDGELLRRIKGIRKKFTQDMGFLAPVVHIRDNLELGPSSYRITLKGVEIGQGEVQQGKFLAINPGGQAGYSGTQLPGTPTVDPTFGLPALWIGAEVRDRAQAEGYTVVDCSTVIATHVNQLIYTHSTELLGRLEVQQLLDHLTKEAPKLVEDVVPKLLPIATVQKVLQNLLDEGLHIRDIRTIVETLAEHGGRTQDPAELTAAVRIALGRAIAQQLFPNKTEMQVVTLEPNLENILLQSVVGGNAGPIEPQLADSLMQAATDSSRQYEQQGQTGVLLVPPALRPMLARLFKRAAPSLRVLSHAEIPDHRTIKVIAMLGGRA
ncbi:MULTISPECIES: flagellar biosynthesis protein FlhA [Ralstonia solanacearum species complex]|uniref:Flagellar biosynthesis protein FlhA n=5 Tax=Ralstonia solanacearum species complex TaxID=3116862 RepID=A0AAD0WJE9_RALSL|nr:MULTISPECIES: flagellar biosynthesis protein FlhA [Ralstonia solanacearum species complex]CCA82514.1 flagellar biosynthesis protein. FHIPEP family [blood disease bacterium R229]BEU74866.1 flagellar biosynthesis protein FlhA [Ralstonia pseudosolanacearum]AMP40252.1 flagellar biosynthesis protein FlhA [Ralstonia solanacearum]AQW31812.1 flagellar biosynthesis protein FlhA [blood disease bacterium A2-HR MARDI]AXV79673.1 flagellar biosynthesis protein FlhA [Ralstonia solanacearum]